MFLHCKTIFVSISFFYLCLEKKKDDSIDNINNINIFIINPPKDPRKRCGKGKSTISGNERSTQYFASGTSLN